MSEVAPSPETRAVEALETMGFQMRDIAHWSHIDVSNRRLIPAEFLRHVRQAIRPVLGRVVIGNITLPRYYDMRPGDEPIYRYQHLPDYRERGNNFRGVLTGLANVTVPTWGESHDDKRLCIRLAPLARLDDEAWQEFYDKPALEARYNHPLEVAENAGRSALIMVNTIREGWLHFPETPQESLQPIYRRMHKL